MVSFWRKCEIKNNYLARFTPHKRHYACFNCRVGLKYITTPNEYNYIETRCGRCGKDATRVGIDCRVPKKKDIKGWKQLKEHIDNGIVFNPRPDDECSVQRRRHTN